MSADLQRVAELAPQIKTRYQALQILSEVTATAKDVADRTADLPLVDGGSRAAIASGVETVLNYRRRVLDELPDPLDDRARQQVALVVAQMESWLRFVDNEVKTASVTVTEWAQSLKEILNGTLDGTLSIIDEVGKQASKTVSDILKAVPWYVWVLAAGALAAIGVIAVKGSKS